MITLHYSVKFRAFGITFGSTSGSVDLGHYLPVQLDSLATGSTVLVDERGVRLVLEVR
jgi:hypothetical protein